MPEIKEVLASFQKDESITPEQMETTLRTLFAMELKDNKPRGRKPRPSQREGKDQLPESETGSSTSTEIS